MYTPTFSSLLTRLLTKKLPINSGLSLDVVESDPATQSAVCALMEIAHDSLDIISWSLSEQLERLAKVLFPKASTAELRPYMRVNIANRCRWPNDHRSITISAIYLEDFVRMHGFKMEFTGRRAFLPFN